LIDAGLSVRAMTERLNGVGRKLSEISALLFTHDHSDHFKGVDVLCRRHPIALFANEGTAAGIERTIPALKQTWEIFETSCRFKIGDLTVEPFNVPHDASDPVGFVISDGHRRLGVATDLGGATTLVRHRLADCDALILEFNHDVEMVKYSSRPKSLQQRILGQHGHLCNEEAAELLAEVLSPRLKVILPAHLSEECNTTALAEAAVRRVLKRAHRGDIDVAMTAQERATSLIAL
jgi:phosphoribosyl 1,2-cyclic phosphodiesterase